MRGYEFVEAVAAAVSDSPKLVLADENPVSLVWGVGSQQDTIVVQTSDGDVFQVSVTRLDGAE